MKCVDQQFINAIKHSTVSTSQLRASQPLHLWPINLVVYEGSLVLSDLETSSSGGLHA